MNKNNLYLKLGLVVLVTALAVWSFTPLSEKVNLGLDLKGGVHLVLGVQTDDALRLESATTSEQLRQAAADQTLIVTTTPALTSFAVQGVPSDRDAEFRTIADSIVGTSWDRSSSGGGNYTFTMRPNIVTQTRRDAVTQAIQTIERRVNELGVAEPNIAEYGSAGDQIMVQLPGLQDVARAKEIIRSTAILEWKLVEYGPMPDRASLLQAYGGTVPADMEVVPGGDAAGVPSFYLLRRVAAVTGRDLRNARPTVDEYNTPAVSFTLNAEGVSKFSRATAANVGRQMAIVLDGRVQSAPTIESAISSAEARITGRFTQQEVRDLSLVLRSGALPASLTYLEEREVGPSLGADSIRAGVLSSIAGLLMVTTFMLFYYRLAGINACVSITLNLVILLGFMAYLGAVMTLPGIAGFVLTIAMGVDSNVLIFERIREELAEGRTARQSVSAGFNRVLTTIIDTHVCSLIAAAFLFQFGTGPIRGFATTLFFGLVSNIFTAVFVSRTLFELILSRRPAGSTRLSI
ncbi:MAG: protein-export membrane protein SecD [Acidobacteria bacterium SCN 69-37]|nr:MAG: protein-export membrane protein SecD [Acidobacteria bacterium SCN 69-37]